MQGIVANGSSSAAMDTGSKLAPDPRLVRAAHEFEAQMMKELLKPMTSDSLPGSDDENGEGSGGALGEFASESLGKALSTQGGFGLANRIVQDVSHSGTRTVNGNPTGNLHS